MPLLISFLNIVFSHVDEHTSNGFWDEFLHVVTDPAHIAAEFVFTILFDLVFITLIYNLLFKKIILPRLRREIHEEIDEAHGQTHEKPDKL